MGDRAVKLILFINRHFPVSEPHQELDSAKYTVSGYQAWEYDEICRIHTEFGDHFNLLGKRVLDIGCGLGGKLRFYAEQGASLVVGVDLRYMSTQAAKHLADEAAAGASTRPFAPMLADAVRLPFAAEEFDVVISVNVLEHVADPEGVTRECHRVLRRDGVFLAHFPPFYSAWGPHLDGWINLPWPHLLFTERDLVAAAAHEEARLHLNRQYIPSGRFDWQRLEALPELNHLTLRGFDRCVRRAGFVKLRWDQLPIGREYLPRKGLMGIAALALLRSLARVPGLDEVLTTKLVCALGKDGAVGHHR
jgi:SAM-dependent methyltransferase